MSNTAVVGFAVVGFAVVGDSPVAVSDAVYLYTPPQYMQQAVMRGSLRYRYPVSTTVYRIGGQWFNVLSPGQDNPVVADCDVISAGDSTLRLYFNKPMVVPGDLHDELAAIQPADDSWSAGTLTLL